MRRRRYGKLPDGLDWLVRKERERWGDIMRDVRFSGDPTAMAGPSMHSGLFRGLGDFAPSADVQVFVPIVCAQTLPAGTAGQDLIDSWVKPKGCQFVIVITQGPGGGGGSGRKGSTSTVCCGGGGGGGGAGALGFFLAMDLADEIELYVTAGGTGAAAITSNDTNGNGSNAANLLSTVFGGLSASALVMPALLLAGGATPGNGGSASSGSGGFSSVGMFAGTAGASASTTGLVGSNASLLSGLLGGAGGGAGGGLTTGNVHSNGGKSAGFSGWINSGLSTGAGTAPGGAGQSGTNGLLNYLARSNGNSSTSNSGLPAPSNTLFQPSSGGAGGASASSADAVSGGNGGNGLWGGGGGGGGAATDTTSPQSGAGGNGGDGYIIVVSI